MGNYILLVIFVFILPTKRQPKAETAQETEHEILNAGLKPYKAYNAIK